MITVASSRSGVSYAETETVRLHSSYDPVKEADKFLQEHISACPSTVILLGPGLNYLADAVRRKCPGTTVFSIYYDSFFFAEAGGDADAGWHPGAGESCIQFIRKRVDEFSFQGLTVLEWPPSAAAFPDMSRQINREIAQFAREMNGSIMATAAFGKKWFTNAFHNAAAPVRFAAYEHNGKPVVITAAGPSLPRCCTVLRDTRNDYSLWALPSSLLTITSCGLVPDLIISTDAGFYSSLHFPPCKQHQDVPVAMPLTAYPVPHLVSNPIVPLSQSTEVEKIILHSAGIHAVPVLPHGTVTGSALNLALQLDVKSVVFAGFDCCYLDIIEHTRPHSFDPLLTLHSTRLEPEYSLLYHRAREQTSKYYRDKKIRTSLPLETYAGWFNRTSFSSSVRLYRLFPSPVELQGMEALDDTDFVRTVHAGKGFTQRHVRRDETPRQPDHSARKNEMQQLLGRLKNNLSLLHREVTTAGSVIPFCSHRELFPLLSLLYITETLDVVKSLKQGMDTDPTAVERTQDLIDQGIRLISHVRQAVQAL